MKTDQTVHVCGSIIKEEALVPVTSHILEHTSVAEANKPYSDYYGIAPFNMPTKPNSLFLFTSQYYTLEEVSRFVRLIDLHCAEKLNIASSVIDFGDHHYPAIRVKNFPDYKQIEKLQECFSEQGVEFARKVHLDGKATIRTNKCFWLEEVGNHLFIDHRQPKTGYVALSKLMKRDNYEKVLAEIRNNTNCPLFNAARGAIFIDGEITDIVRVYSDHLDIKMLQLIQEHFEKFA